jgi:hypothetical protein
VDFAYIIRAIMTLEGIALQLDPEFDIWAVSAPYAARMMLTFPDPSIRRRLMDELLTDEGGLDWERLGNLAALASRDTGFRLKTEGLAEPALDMLLSPEGAALRRALIAELMDDPESAAEYVDQLAPLVSADSSVSGRAILYKLVGFLLSPEGEETRVQLMAGFREGDNGDRGLDLARVMDLASMASRLHPDFRTGTLISAVGGYLLSEEGKPARNQLLVAGAQWAIGGLASVLGRLAQPVEPPQEMPALVEGEQEAGGHLPVADQVGV